MFGPFLSEGCQTKRISMIKKCLLELSKNYKPHVLSLVSTAVRLNIS